MTDQPKIEFDKDLDRGTAEFHDRFRPPYPADLLNDLSARAGLTAQSRVLDLACGTGQIAFGVAASVAEVWAIDQEPEFIDLGKHNAQRLGVGNIRWDVAAAEDLALEASFDLVAMERPARLAASPKRSDRPVGRRDEQWQPHPEPMA